MRFVVVVVEFFPGGSALSRGGRNDAGGACAGGRAQGADNVAVKPVAEAISVVDTGLSSKRDRMPQVDVHMYTQLTYVYSNE